MQLYVWNHAMSEKYPVEVECATMEDFKDTTLWQTQWTSLAVAAMPNKVALRRADTDELLGLMSYDLNEQGLAVEVIYIESAAHSNANLLHRTGEAKKYVGIARALFTYAVQVSLDSGFDGVIFFRAKTSQLRTYYMKEFGAVPMGRYDPFRLIIWEDAAAEILASYEEVD